MYLFLIILLELYVALRWINGYVLILLVLLYLMSYFDGKEYTGERRWEAFRRFRLWKWFSSIEYRFTQQKELELINYKVKRIYVMVPGFTYVPVVWGIGLHGGMIPSSSMLHYVVPPVFMWIPLLRDVLLWSGAVTFHSKKLPLTDLLLNLMQTGRSVCYCPSEFNSGGDVEVGGSAAHLDVPTACPSDEILTFCRAESVQLVPVVVHGELRRYHIATVFRPIQDFFMNHIGYPFPLCFWTRICGKERPPILSMQFGSILECNAKYENNDQLRESLGISVEGLTCTELGDDNYKLR